MAITAQMVKELREKTGAGMMDCKKALQEADGDEQKAIEELRKKGLSKAAKKAGRSTSEGLIALEQKGDKTAALVELLCETDFVARNDMFQDTLKAMAESVVAAPPACGADHGVVHQPTDECWLNHDVGGGKSVADKVKDLIAVLGENMQAGRYARIEVEGAGIIGSYLHMNSKIGVIVELKCLKAESADHEEFQALAKDVAMQIAAASPVCVASAEVPQDLLDRERAIFRDQALAEGKPENVVEKIVEGRVNKYFKEICLLDQPFIKDDKKSVSQLIKEVSKTVNDTIEIGRFARLQVGEDAE